jgi:beta-RFAP synthase
MTAVRVTASARLHLGMLDVAGGRGRRYGGVGVAIADPAVVLEANPAADTSAEGPDAERALAFARRFVTHTGIDDGVCIRVHRAIPPHVGLGSGTKLGLAVIAALAELNGLALSPIQVARTAGRGARSAVGLWTFLFGGLVTEGGVRPDSGCPAPLLARHPVPEQWRCVLVVPDRQPGLSGVTEEEAFRRLRPPQELSALISQLVLTCLLPALVEQDLVEFGAAVTHLQRLVGEAFSPVQGGPFHPLVSRLVDALLDSGAAGAGQSSWGPAAYGFVGTELEADALAKRMARLTAGEAQVSAVPFDNRGATVETLCVSS